jgi:hypothetical protein
VSSIFRFSFPEVASLDLKHSSEKRGDEALIAHLSPRRAKSPRKIGGVPAKVNLKAIFQEQAAAGMPSSMQCILLLFLLLSVIYCNVLLSR